MFVVPVTVAVNCCVALVWIEAEVGLIDTEAAGAAVTVTVAEADWVLSATLVAFTVYVPAVVGAEYSPELLTEPPVADHVTAVFDVPLTVAVNCCVALVCKATESGLMLIEIGLGEGFVPLAAAPTPQPEFINVTIRTETRIMNETPIDRERYMLASLRLVRSLTVSPRAVVL